MQTAKDKKDKPPSYLACKKLVFFLLFSLTLTFIIHINYPHLDTEYKAGDIAQKNIKSPEDIPVEGVGGMLKKGEIIVREGERISEAQLSSLSALKTFDRAGRFDPVKFLAVFALLFLAVTVTYECAERNVKKFILSEKDVLFGSLLTIFTAIFVKSSFLIFGHFAPEFTPDLFYILPIFLFGIIMRIVLFSEAAIIFSLILSITMGFAFQNGLQCFIYTLLGNFLAAHFAGKCENRDIILKAGLYTACIMAFVMVLFHLFSGEPFSRVPIKIFFTLLGGIGSSFIALGLLPIIEYLFGYTTDIKLLELANLEHPLLEEMMVSAPGTYHHSILVGNLAKAAAESIGAHPLLTRVSAYYHDIGKLKMPRYFIENRVGFEDAHKSLTPHMSALVILSHVKEGVDLAAEYKLGTRITDIIQQHHGTSMVTFFYNRAKGLEDPKLHSVQEKDFRYTGPKPQTKEAGILMLADAVEAASRILSEPTPKRIETHVQDIVERIFIDGQLDECELTLKDLHAIQKSFIAILIGIFHQRIEYPERIYHDGNDKRLPKIAEGEQGTRKADGGKLTSLFKAAG
jgi:putative nucleotidyltransferase with HDIG domain